MYELTQTGERERVGVVQKERRRERRGGRRESIVEGRRWDEGRVVKSSAF